MSRIVFSAFTSRKQLSEGPGSMQEPPCPDLLSQKAALRKQAESDEPTDPELSNVSIILGAASWLLEQLRMDAHPWTREYRCVLRR